MKIKVKKEMTLPQLIEWAWENGIKSKVFVASKGGRVEFTPMGFFKTHILVAQDDLFEVEVDEEVTEETVISNLLEVYEDGFGDLTTRLYKKGTIRRVLELDASRVKVKTFYILQDDMTMTLIWKDGEMVE